MGATPLFQDAKNAILTMYKNRTKVVDIENNF